MVVDNQNKKVSTEHEIYNERRSNRGWVVLGAYAGANDAGWEATTAINLAGLWHTGIMGAAFGTAFGLGVGAGIGFVVGL